MSKIIYYLGAGASYGRRDEDKKIIVCTDLDRHIQANKEEEDDSINNSSQYNYLLIQFVRCSM